MSTDEKGLGKIAHNAISHPSIKPADAGLIHKGMSEQIIGAAFEVHNSLGYGFLEKVYQRAMEVELGNRGLRVEVEYPVEVHYRGVLVGQYFADLRIESAVLVEIKVAERYNPQDEPQLLNLLKATSVKLGLLVNFGKSKVEFKRLVF